MNLGFFGSLLLVVAALELTRQGAPRLVRIAFVTLEFVLAIGMLIALLPV